MCRKSLLLRLLLGICWLPGSFFTLSAQTDTPPAIRFNGLGRTLINSTELKGELAETDSMTAKNLLDGEFLLDLQINASPNENTEIQTILRLRNEFGGFFGSGMSVEVRELIARGVVANSFRYHVGDMDLEMTPFTLFQADEEGTVNTPEIFRGRKEVIDYEQFFEQGNSRRMQGAKFEFGLAADPVLAEINFTGFFTRIRGTDFFNLPSRYVGGGSVDLLNTRWGGLTGNYVNTFDSRQIGNFSTGIRNPVLSLQADIRVLETENYALSLKGEGGQSTLTEVTDSLTTFESQDNFLEAMAEYVLKPQHLTFSLGYRYTGPEFFSIAAQSKRVAFDRTLAFYPRFGNEQMRRMPTIFDLNRDRALYTFALSDVLMPYDARLSNTMPYGRATPNRMGAFASVAYEVPEGPLDAQLDVARMQEIRGQGTLELKAFTLLRARADLHAHRLLNREKALTLTLGYQYESTQRGGEPIEQISLNSNLIEAGLQIELFDSFDLLFGATWLVAQGNEYLPDVVRFNVVRDFPRASNFDEVESMIAAGIRYRFREDMYLSIQWDRFSLSRPESEARNYRVDQPFILYNMNF
jgi:hypothetical protein